MTFERICEEIVLEGLEEFYDIDIDLRMQEYQRELEEIRNDTLFNKLKNIIFKLKNL